jgi:hypothetical protein
MSGLEPNNDELIDSRIYDLAVVYDEITADDLKQEIRRLRRLLNLQPEGDERPNNLKALQQWVVKWRFT